MQGAGEGRSGVGVVRGEKDASEVGIRKLTLNRRADFIESAGGRLGG
jgi:hypothetical protein